jgi:hypothetical protein
MWVVAFGLLADLTGTRTCSGRWYVNYWGWYWSGTASLRACSNWRAVLAFSCISWILFMVSAMVVSSIVMSCLYRHANSMEGSLRAPI